jgi:hypothetical protein
MVSFVFYEWRSRGTNLAKFSNVADTFALEGLKVSGDATVFKIDNSGKRLVEEGSKRGDGESTRFCLFPYQ